MFLALPFQLVCMFENFHIILKLWKTLIKRAKFLSCLEMISLFPNACNFSLGPCMCCSGESVCTDAMKWPLCFLLWTTEVDLQGYLSVTLHGEHELSEGQKISTSVFITRREKVCKAGWDSEKGH